MKSILLGLLLPIFLGPAAQDPAPALRGLDPVLLCGGEEVAGREELALERHGHRYLFATAATREAFLADPARHEIQMGGGCGRMGPLSGKGDPGRFIVHAGRVYVFASDACRTAFASDPARFLEADDPRPAPTADEAAAARALLERAVAAHGGAERIDGARGLRLVLERVERSGETDYRVVDEHEWRFPDGYRHVTNWNDWRYVQATGPEGGFEVDDAGALERMHPVSGRALRREGARELLSLLRARSEPGVVVAPAGAGEIGGAAVDRVAIYRDGATTTLSIDRESGLVLALAWRGRPSTGHVGDVVMALSDAREVGGLVLPHARATSLDGAAVVELSGTWSALEVDPELAPEEFTPSAR